MATDDDAAPTRLLDVPGFTTLWLSSWLWHTTRWGGLFTCSYLVTKLSDSPLLNQLVGASIFAPMLLGGLAAGALSDRFDRRRIILTMQMVLMPVTVVMAVLVQTGNVRVWMVFPFMLCVGTGGLVNMTAQRVLIYETVGPRLAGRALSIETVGMASASMSGALAGGAIIEAVGIGAAFGLLAMALSMSFLLLRRVPAPRFATATVADPSLPAASMRAQISAGVGLLHRSPGLTSMLGITVVMNLFCFSFLPLVPVMAERLGANALRTGVLGAGAGSGQLVAGLVLASRHVSHRGHVYVAGAAIALGGMGLFASAPTLALAFVALLLAGAGQAGFGSMQSVLVIESATESERGAALGLLSTAIGALPLGMLLVGVNAQALGAPLALRLSSTAGLLTLFGWLYLRPHVLARSAEAIELPA